MANETTWPWLQIVRHNDVLNSANVSQIISASLLASGDGTEVIHHRLVSGTYWTIEPNNVDMNVDMMEAVFVLNGTLQGLFPQGCVEFTAGDSLSVQSIPQKTVFQALSDTDFLYISSEPVFEHYSQSLTRTQNLAIRIEEKDGYTSHHCKRIMRLSLLLGQALNLQPEELYRLQFGSFFHDIGKVRIPIEILNKPGPLSPDDWTLMKLHPILGEQILRESGMAALVDASGIVAQHHERLNGSGYPLGLQGDEIHIGAAIVAVADSYDAMTSTRSYRQTRSPKEALAEIASLRGTLYHPQVVDAFMSLFNK